MDEMRDNPPGWYRDPDHPRWHRYWDGTAWSEPLDELLRAERRRAAEDGARGRPRGGADRPTHMGE